MKQTQGMVRSKKRSVVFRILFLLAMVGIAFLGSVAIFIMFTEISSFGERGDFCESQGGVPTLDNSFCIIGEEEYNIRKVEGGYRLTR